MSFHLYIDSTLWGCAPALIPSGASQEEYLSFEPQRGGADSSLCRMLEEGLRKLGARCDQIDTIVVSHGPGSFTGIKVGLAWAYGIQAASKESMLVGMSSLEEGAKELCELNNVAKLAILLPINRRSAFLARTGGNNSLEGDCKPIQLNSSEAEEELKGLKREGYFFYLLAPEEKTQNWFESMGIQTEFLSMETFMETALRGMLRRGRTMDMSKERTRLVHPHYMKKTSVEETLEQRSRNVT